jgi:hypothetical protein
MSLNSISDYLATYPEEKLLKLLKELYPDRSKCHMILDNKIPIYLINILDIQDYILVFKNNLSQQYPEFFI